MTASNVPADTVVDNPHKSLELTRKQLAGSVVTVGEGHEKYGRGTGFNYGLSKYVNGASPVS